MDWKKEIIGYMQELHSYYADEFNESDIKKFKSTITEYDINYINIIIGKCTNWTLKKDISDKYVKMIEREELNAIRRLKYSIERYKAK